MFSWFKSNERKDTKKKRNGSLISNDAQNFLTSFSSNNVDKSRSEIDTDDRHDIIESNASTLDSTTKRICNDVERMEKEKCYTQMRWRVPDDINAASVAKKCSGKYKMYRFTVEKVGKLAYVTVKFT